jgi:hypothetical protein
MKLSFTRSSGSAAALRCCALALICAGTLALAPTSSATGRSGTARYDAEVATAWFDLALELTRTTAGFSPPVASRAFGYLGLTLYESVVGGMPKHQSLEGQLNGLVGLPEVRGPHHWPTVANAALAAMARELYAGSTAQAAQNLAAIDDLEQEIARRLGRGHRGSTGSAALGRAIAGVIAKWARGDGGHEGHLRNFPADYVHPVAPGLWEPTPPGFQRALQPFWDANRPFAASSASWCNPGPPPPYSEEPGSAFHAEAFEVYETVENLTPEQLEIARFWSDDPGITSTPPGHSISILTQVLQQQRSRLDVAAEGYARVGMAVADAFISCWWSKYRYNLVRPITYVHDVIDPDWTLPLNTPPFPEYTSGHSVQSGAMAEVMTALFGDLAFTDATHVDRGFAPRSFDSFYEAANEAAISRLYGGIHYRAAIERGVAQGRCVGAEVNALQFRKPKRKHDGD